MVLPLAQLEAADGLKGEARRELLRQALGKGFALGWCNARQAVSGQVHPASSIAERPG
jgi:hypothetical protein